tara:strand:+ start:1804 stop:2115 length:312 start_codon:yes stop_codon:yes gene_type:complete
MVLCSRAVDFLADIYYIKGITNNEPFRKNQMHFEIYFDTAANATAYANGFDHELDSIEVLDIDEGMNRVVVHVPWKPEYRGSFTQETMDRVGVVDVDCCDVWD